jgi:hypothetical protein
MNWGDVPLELSTPYLRLHMMLQSKRPNAFFRSLRDQPQRRRPPGLSGLSYDVRGRLRGNVTADLRIAILEAFQEAGILIPSRQAEVTLQTIDLLRETAEYLASDSHRTRVEARRPAAGLFANLPRKPANLARP